MVKFITLHEGDHFEHGELRFKVVPLVKSGACGCTKQHNAQSIDDEELFGLFSDLHDVTKIHVYRTHPDNIELVHKELRYLKRMIYDEQRLQKESNEIFVEPSISDSLVVFEPTDTWLLYFELGTPVKKPYYEKLERTRWVGQN